VKFGYRAVANLKSMWAFQIYKIVSGNSRIKKVKINKPMNRFRS